MDATSSKEIPREVARARFSFEAHCGAMWQDVITNLVVFEIEMVFIWEKHNSHEKQHRWYRLFRLVEIQRNPNVVEDALAEMWKGKSEKYAGVYRVISPVMIAIRNLAMGVLLACVLL